jgi:hypothetical protein
MVHSETTSRVQTIEGRLVKHPKSILPKVQKPEGSIVKNTYKNVNSFVIFNKDTEDGRWHSYSDHERLVQK